MKYVLPFALCAMITFNCWAAEPVLDATTHQSFMNSGRVMMDSLQSKDEQELLSKAMVFYMMGAGNGWTSTATNSKEFIEERYKDLDSLNAYQIIRKYKSEIR